MCASCYFCQQLGMLSKQWRWAQAFQVDTLAHNTNLDFFHRWFSPLLQALFLGALRIFAEEGVRYLQQFRLFSRTEALECLVLLCFLPPNPPRTRLCCLRSHTKELNCQVVVPQRWMPRLETVEQEFLR